MLRYILFDTTLFGDQDSNTSATEKNLMWCLEALVQRNMTYLKYNPRTPPMYKSGIVYKVPAQFDGDCPEVQVLRRVLGNAADRGAVAEALDTIQQVLGGERFRDIGRIIENGGGDCLPVDTLVETPWGRRPIGDLAVGDVITSHVNCKEDHRTVVTKVWPRSTKPTITMFLSDGTKVVASPEHRLLSAHAGMCMQFWELWNLDEGDDICAYRDGAIKYLKIAVKEPSAARECVDISTESRTFVLSQGCVITHNCDNVASWRVAELRQAGIQARPWMTKRTRPDGGTTYHALVQWPPFGAGNLGNESKWTSEDPSLLLGMGGASRTAERAEEIRKNKERCEIIQKYGTGGPPVRQVTAEPILDFGSEWEEVLGLRRRQMPVEIPRTTLEIDKILSRERG